MKEGDESRSTDHIPREQMNRPPIHARAIDSPWRLNETENAPD